MKKKISLGVLLILVVIQFFQADKTNPETIENQTFEAIAQPSENIKKMLQDACYDCHSNATKYPWYTYINPVGWWIKGHINNGREHLNFSIWGTYEKDKQAHKLEECAEETEALKMPMKSYAFMHGGASLTEDQRKTLVAWFEENAKNIES